jgi:hypothetical protein
VIFIVASCCSIITQQEDLAKDEKEKGPARLSLALFGLTYINLEVD